MNPGLVLTRARHAPWALCEVVTEKAVLVWQWSYEWGVKGNVQE
uniref:Uncharacterized protein n=1 Tax=Arundo donax TaxID=35708 RepID=A0A0A9E1Z1_ARUDO